MSRLDDALSHIRNHEGVRQVILLGRDGLVVQRLGEGGADDDEPVAARIPLLAASCEALGEAAHTGAFLTNVIEYEQGVVIVLGLHADLLLAVLVEPGVGFAPLLRTLRTQRGHLVDLL